MLEHGRQVFFVREMVYALALVALCPSHPVLLRGASRRSFLFSPPLVLIKSWRATGAGWGGMRTLIPFFLLIVEIRGDYARYSSTNESTSFCVDRSVGKRSQIATCRLVSRRFSFLDKDSGSQLAASVYDELFLLFVTFCVARLGLVFASRSNKFC